MAQHFLLTAAARTLTLASVARMSDEAAEMVFIRLRWPDNDGKPFCPKCGCVTVYGSRRKGCLRWQCKACHKDFSLTSGTLFRQPQDAAARLPDGDCDLRERGQGQVDAGDVSRPWHLLQNEF